MILITDYSINECTKYFNKKYLCTIVYLNNYEELNKMLNDYGSIQIWAKNPEWFNNLVSRMGKRPLPSTDKISKDDTIISIVNDKEIVVLKLEEVIHGGAECYTGNRQSEFSRNYK